MNNPLNATDPLGLQSASENDKCSPNSARPIGDGNARVPGLECGTGALDSSDPGDAPQCSTDPNAPCIVLHTTSYAQDTLDQSELIASISEMLNHMAVFQQLVNGTWHPSDSRFWNVTKAFFTNFSIFGPSNDPRPSCFGNFIKDSVGNFVGVPGVDTIGAAATVHYGISSRYFTNAVPNTRVSRGDVSPKQWLAADEATRVSKAGKFSLLVNADLAMGQAFFQNELPQALAGECK